MNKNITVLVGPNGSGKTHYLDAVSKRNKKSSLYIKAEMLFSDLMKDGNKESLAFEYIVSEILSDGLVSKGIDNLNDAIINATDKKKEQINNIWKESASISGPTKKGETEAAESILTVDKIETTSLKYVKLSTKNFTKMGTGQKMYFLLKMTLEFSNKKIILLDEPEKYCHPSLLNKIAGLINEMATQGKEIYVATHSPELLKMLSVPFENIYIMDKNNRIKYGELRTKGKFLDIKKVFAINKYRLIDDADCSKIYNDLIADYDKDMDDDKVNKFYWMRNYFKNEENLKAFLDFRYKDIVSMFFTKKLYLVEGENDGILLKKRLSSEGELYNEYSIINAWGKPYMFFLIKIFNYIRPEDSVLKVIFDEDNVKENFHKNIDQIIINNVDEYIMYSFNLEDYTKYNDWLTKKFNVPHKQLRKQKKQYLLV